MGLGFRLGSSIYKHSAPMGAKKKEYFPGRQRFLQSRWTINRPLLRDRLRNRFTMTRRHGLTTKNKMTLRAFKVRFRFSLINLVIQRPALIGRCGYVTTLGSPA